MFSLLAIQYNAARPAFEAQNAMAFRLLRLVENAPKLAPPTEPKILDAEVAMPPAAQKVALVRKQRASARRVHKKMTRAKKVAKRTK